MNTINPVTNETVKTYKEHTSIEVDEKINAAHKAFLSWKEVSFTERSGILNRAAEVLLRRKQEFAELMAIEMGKPLKQGIAEIEKCASACEYYAKNAAAFLQSEEVKTDASKSFVTFNPIGVVLAIMPWNFPFWQVFRFLAPALMAGNTGVLKHASNVPGCALAIEGIIREAGFPDNVFQTLLIGSKDVDAVIEHKHIKAVTLTGSTQAGKKVATKAGSLIKKTVLELGGSDAYIILEDADLQKAAEICVASRLINGGQSCIAAKRFIVVQPIAEKFIEKFKELMASKKLGDPFEASTDIGPMARIDLRDELHEQVKRSITAGAKCILGGEIPNQPGAFYPPTMLTNITKGNPAYEEELFGPVASILIAQDEQEAIFIANDTSYGLGAALFTEDKIKAERIASELLEAGSCFVNSLVKSDPRLPFGGIKESGYGRELGLYGIKEFVNIKTIFIA